MAYFKEINKLNFLCFDLLEKQKKILHFSTTRMYDGGSDFSMSFYKNEKHSENHKTDKEKLADALGIKPEQFVFCRQTHSDNVAVINSNEKDRGFYNRSTAITDTDGVITASKNVCPVALTADCVPVVLYDPVKRVAAAVHSGWRGTAKQILVKAIFMMRDEHKCNPSDVICCIGPSAGPCCYEVGDDVVNAFAVGYKNHLKYFDKKPNGKYLADLWKANRDLALQSGLSEHNIEIANVCTMCNNDLFHSARIHKASAGRMATGIMMV